MWYAYGLVDTVSDILRLIRNLAAWTKPEGTCFVPLGDPRLMSTGIVWSYIEDDGKVHTHQIAPNIEFMVEQFEVFFESVTIVRYPPVFPGSLGRPALVARRKRAAAADHAAQSSGAIPATGKP
jgi:hypothetical protein